MTKEVRFWLDRAGAREVVLRYNQELTRLEIDYASKLLAQIQASFFQEFGFQGKFEMVYKPTPLRSAYRVRATDARTTAVLKRSPQWLSRFVSVPL